MAYRLRNFPRLIGSGAGVSRSSAGGFGFLVPMISAATITTAAKTKTEMIQTNIIFSPIEQRRGDGPANQSVMPTNLRSASYLCEGSFV